MTDAIDTTRALSFDAEAELYDRARPRYPDELFDELLAWFGADAPVRVLEVGAGTGIATRGFVERGCDVTVIEPGANLAAILHRNLPEVTIVNAALEDADIPAEAFDLVTSAQAWHWVDPQRGAKFAAQVLRPGGAIVLWWAYQATRHFGPLGPQLGAAFDRAFQTPPGTAEDYDRRPPSIDALAASGLFGPIEECMYTLHQTLTSTEYVDLVRTWSGVATLDDARCTPFLAELEAIVDANGGSLEMNLPVPLFRARRV